MQIAVGRTRLLCIGAAVLGQLLPRPGEPFEIACRHREICFRQEPQPLQFPVACHEEGEHQQQEAAEHHLCGRGNIIAVDEHNEHRRKDERPRENIARTLRVLRPRECERVLPHIFIELFLQNETPYHSYNN